jgi:REP element-mobilizing transposase RayT
MGARKPNRLPEYDYSRAGCYFITVCTMEKQCLFWRAVGADIIRPEALPLTPYGQIAERCIRDIPVYYPYVTLHHWVVMPNHIHLLLEIGPLDGRMISAPTKSVSIIVGQMKRAVSKAVGRPIWQKGFYDHVIRDEADFLTRWNYIDTNSARWADSHYQKG